MSTYRLYFTTTASAVVTVEADSLEDAIDAAETPTICAQCSGWGRDYGLDIGDDWEFDESAHEVDGEYIETRVLSEGIPAEAKS